MEIINNIIRKLLIYLSFPNNLKKEVLSNLQLKTIDEVHIKLENLLDETFDNKLKTHKIFSENVFSLIKNKNLDNFLRKSFIQKMFFVHNRFYIIKFLKNILNTKSKFWINLLEENSIGNPVPFFLYKKSSGNRIRHVYLLKKILDYGEINQIDSVVEIGGGYGCMLSIIKKINSNVEYTIFDLAEVNLLQYYYLKSNNINCDLDNIIMNINLISKLELLKRKVEILKQNEKTVLVIANWSISEMPITLRKNLEFLFEECDYGIVSYQDKFENIENVGYFKDLSNKLSKNFMSNISNLNEMNSKLKKNKHYMLLLKKR